MMPRHLSRGKKVPSPWSGPVGEWAGHTERACSWAGHTERACSNELWRDSCMNGASIPFAQIDRRLTGRIGAVRVR